MWLFRLYSDTMKSMALFISNASRVFDEQILNKLEAAYERACKTAAQLLSLKEFDVVCIADKTMVIPEIGIGGYTPNRYLIYLYIDPDTDINEDEIFNTLCHELHHAKRYESEGCGDTLLDSMIFEGLAIAFEEEVSSEKAFMPSQLLSRSDTKSLLKKVKAHFNDEDFDHFRWFIFDSTGELPRWTGYEVGYYLVRHYLLDKNKKASELVLEAPSSFV